MLDTNKQPDNHFAAELHHIESIDWQFHHDLPLTSKLTANTAGRFTMMASCEPTNCKIRVADFVSPAGASTEKGALALVIRSTAM